MATSITITRKALNAHLTAHGKHSHTVTMERKGDQLSLTSKSHYKWPDATATTVLPWSEWTADDAMDGSTDFSTTAVRRRVKAIHKDHDDIPFALGDLDGIEAHQDVTGVTAVMDTKDLKPLLKKLLYCAYNEKPGTDKRDNLRAVVVSDGRRAYASDGLRASMVELPRELWDLFEGERLVGLPSNALRILQWSMAREKYEEVHFQRGEQRIVVEGRTKAGTTMCALTLPFYYGAPAIQKSWPDKSQSHIEAQAVTRQELIKVLKKLNGLAEPQDKEGAHVSLTFKARDDHQLSLATPIKICLRTVEDEDVHEQELGAFVIDYRRPDRRSEATNYKPMRIGVNAKLLKQAAESLSDTHVRIYIQHELYPILVLGEDRRGTSRPLLSEKVQAVVMPTRE